MGKTKEQRRNWLQVLTDFVEQKMAPPLLRIAQIRYAKTAVGKPIYVICIHISRTRAVAMMFGYFMRAT